MTKQRAFEGEPTFPACSPSTGDTVDGGDGASPLFSVSGWCKRGDSWYWENPGNGTPELSALSVFFRSWHKMGHAVLPLCKTPRRPGFLTAFRRGDFPARLGAAAACRYHNTVAPYGARRLLLPLCGNEARGRLREDVRFQEICVSLVGQGLREAAHELAEARLACRTAVSTSQAVGARPTLEHSSRLLT